MAKVTSVEPQKSSKGRSASGRKNPKRFNVYLDGVFAFGADSDTVVEFRLIPGKVIDPQSLDKILFETEIGKLIDRVYGLLNIRPRSEKEIRDYLKNLSFKRKVKGQEELSQVVIDSLIEKLKQKNLINDLQFAKDWTKSRMISKKKGKIAIKSELMQKGINREIIDQVLEQTEVSEQALATQALLKKLKSLSGYPYLEQKQKGLQFFIKKGV